MGLSIITPHYNDLDGLKRIYSCLMGQTNMNWEWIIVDDFSDKGVLPKIRNWKKGLDDNRIRFIENVFKTNASVCRNKGIDIALFDNLIFLDSDDCIANDFVANRHVKFKEFAIFPNYHVVDGKGEFVERRLKNKQDFLNRFLAAQFLWQTSCILWDKEFLIKIGEFDPNLQRLQDVELSIRALIFGKTYRIIDNTIDFFYNPKPISSKKDIVKKSCASVNYLISKLRTNYNLEAYSRSLTKAYYYACVKGLQRCKNREDVVHVMESLKLFYKEKYINAFQYFVGFSLLILYQFHMISDSLFIRTNRYFFK